MSDIILFFIQTFIIIAIPMIAWNIKIIKRFFPLVVVQILVGVIIGPSFTGNLFPEIYSNIWNENSIKIINEIGFIAVIFFCMLVGTEFDIKKIKGKGISFGITALASIVIPFLLCTIAAAVILFQFPHLIGEKGDTIAYILGVATAGSVTALPVLASILYDIGYITKKIGKVAIGIATFNDAALWILVSIVIAFSAGERSIIKTVTVILILSGYYIFMITIMKKLLQKVESNILYRINNYREWFMLVMIGVLTGASAFFTHVMGIHYLFGAFIAGVIIPLRSSEIIKNRLEKILKNIMLPFFFVSTGLKTDFSFYNNSVLMILIVITISSTIGKIAGTAIVSKMSGLLSSWRDAFKLGNFISCKGLMEIVILNILFESKIIGIETFSGLMIMALITTVLTKPVHILIENGEENRLNNKE